ncbi:MAG: F0F1 ATP synthase subunit B [Sedimentisphaerales bacterium]|nr:F0F1 ATP synthase subunit B [Sedimentisphaerales bacterium]
MFRLIKPIWLWGGCLLVLSRAAVGADEHGGETAQVSVFSGDMVLSVLTLVVFVILLAVLFKFAWKPLLANLQQREDNIRRAIESADAAQAEAKASMEEYKNKLAEARRQAQEMVAQAQRDAETTAKKLEEAAQAQAEQLRRQAQDDIARSTQQALEALQARTADLAADLAGKVLKRTLNDEEHRDLIRQSLSEMQKQSE